MSKKKKNAILISLFLILLVAGCVAGVYFYAQYTINKPKVEVPDKMPDVSKTEITDRLDKASYVGSVFSACFTEESQVTKSASGWIDGSTISSSSLSQSDLNMMKLVGESALGSEMSLYNTYENVRGDKVTEKPVFSLKNSDISGSEFIRGRVDEYGENIDDEYYFFTLTVEGTTYPAGEEFASTFDTATDEKIYGEIITQLRQYADITAEKVAIKGCNISGQIERKSDNLINIELTHTYTITLSMNFKGDYSSLGSSDVTFDVVIDQKYDVLHYGAGFTEDEVYMNPKDSQLLPVYANIAADESNDNFSLKFTSSDESALTIDSDGIATANKVTDKPVTVTVELKYNGHTYTDTLLVTITDEEIETEAQ